MGITCHETAVINPPTQPSRATLGCTWSYRGRGPGNCIPPQPCAVHRPEQQCPGRCYREGRRRKEGERNRERRCLIEAEAFARGDHDELLDQGDTLLMLIQQHNQKEEHILYPMCENALDAQWTELHERLAAYPPIE